MSFPRYPAYKDSSVEWLGEVPAHWNAIRLKHSVRIVNERLDAKPEESIFLGLENIESQTGRLLIEATADEVESVVGVFQAGDILFGKLRPYLAKVVRPNFSGVCTTELLTIRPDDQNDGQFLLYQLLSEPVIKLVDSYTYGSKMPRANAEQISNTVFPTPPLAEQRAIAAFLDAETARIDTLVAKQEALIATLQEKRRALISHAVTRGLDPAAPMRDSGVPWLGAVPAHWEIVQFRRYIKSMCDGPFGSDMKSSHYVDEGIRLIRLQNISNGFFDDEDKAYISEEHFAALPGHDAKPGDLLVAGLGDLNHPVGRACVLPEHTSIAMVKADCFRLRLDEDKLLHTYAALFLCSEPVRANVVLQMRGATRDRINLTGVSQLLTLIPPVAEQAKIIDYLDQETSQIDTLVAKAQALIGLLREHRTALVAAAVTGQIDVRGWEAR